MLGPVEVARADAPLDLGARKQRLVAAALLVAAPEVVSVDALLHRVWGDRPPASAAHALQVYVSNLRKLLEPDRAAGTPAKVLVTADPGYALAVPDGACDARRFEALVRASEATEDPDEQASVLGRALGCWRGPALADVADRSWAGPEAARLDGLRLTAVERRFDAELACGRHLTVVDELEAAAREHPLRERLWQQLVLALYRGGRQADALRAHAEIRRRLADDLGLEPGPELVALEAAVLRQDPALTWAQPERGSPTGSRSAAPTDQVVPAPASVGTDAEPEEAAAGDDVPAPDERRIVTVLFADLVGSTPLGEALADEEYRLVVDDAMRRMGSACEQFGGRVVNLAGDGVTVLFGAPRAHEDDAERAVLAGLRLVDVVAAYGHEVAAGWGVEPLEARVGINTGPVVTGMAVAGGHTGYTALGDTVNTAARLEAAARPGSVLVGRATREQLGPSFTWSEPRPLDLKGKSAAVEAFEAVGGQPGGGRPRGIADRPTRLHARAPELDTALRAVDDVATGRGSVLVMTGAPGLGKSRLVAELEEASGSRGDPDRPVLWLQGTCLSYGEGQPLWPVREVIAAWAGVSLDQPELRLRVTLRSRVEKLFGGEADVASTAYAALAAVLGIDEPAVATLIGSTDTSRVSLHPLVCGVIERIARDRPVVIAIDDVHWADGETLRLLGGLAEHVERAAVLLVLAGRSEPAHGSWELFERIRRELPHRSSLIELRSLDRSAAATLLEELIGAGTLPREVHDQVLDLSEGNPFYLEELVRTLMADGVLVRDGGRLRHEGGSVRLPDSVEQVVVSRLDRVDHEVRSVLTAASVLGREFDRSLLDPLVELTGGSSRLDQALVELQRLHLVREVRRWPEPAFAFEHALIREAAYDTLVASRRQELHRRAATILAGRDDAGAAAAELAWHWALAGDDEQALAGYRRAGELAEQRGTLTGASTLYAAALAAAARLGGDRGGVHDLAPLLVARWSAAFNAGEREGVVDGLTEAIELARAESDPATEARGLEALALASIKLAIGRDRRSTFLEALEAARRADDPVTVARTLGRLAIDEANDLLLREAHAHALEAMEVVESSDGAAEAFALDGRKLVALYLGELDVLGAVVAELVPILEKAPALIWMRRYAVAEGALLDLAVGAGDLAEEKAVEALELTRRVSERTDREVFLAVLCGVRRALGRYGPALEAGREACDLAVAGRTWWVPWAVAEQGSLLLDLGRDHDALECLRQGVGVDPTMASQEVRCAGLLALAGHRSADRDAEQAGLDVVDDLLGRASYPAGTTYLYGADGVLAAAEVRSALGEHDAAVEQAETVAAAAEAVGWLEPAARARHVLGLDAARRGDPDRAAAHLRRAIAHAGEVLPGRAWRSHAALGAVSGDSVPVARAHEIVDDLARALDEPERTTFRAAALR